jgi:hypothetical protein
MALMVQSVLLASWTVRERNMVVTNIVEEVDLFFLEHECRGDGVDRSIAPAFVEETARLVERVEVVNVGFGAQPVKITNFEVGPLRLISAVFIIGGTVYEVSCYAQNDNDCRSCHRHH